MNFNGADEQYHRVLSSTTHSLLLDAWYARKVTLTVMRALEEFCAIWLVL